MSGYSRGRVAVVNNSTAVTPLWELLVAPSTVGLVNLQGVRFTSSNAQAIVRAHDRVSGRLVVQVIGATNFPGGGLSGLNDGSPVYPGELISGPTLVALYSGVTLSGSGTLTLNTNQNVALNALAGKWVGIKIGLGEGAEEWRRIGSNTAGANSVLTVSPAWTATPSAAGIAFQVRDEFQFAFSAFSAGTPQDWAAAGIIAGHRFTVIGEDRSVVIQSVEANPSPNVTGALVLAVPGWQGATNRNASFGISTQRTANRDYNRSWQNVANRAALLTELVDMLDADLAYVLANLTGGTPGSTNPPSGWTTIPNLAPFNSVGPAVLSYCYLPPTDTTVVQGGVLAVGQTSTGGYITAIGGIPPNRCPLSKQIFSFQGESFGINPDGSITYETPNQTNVIPGYISLCCSFRADGAA